MDNEEAGSAPLPEDLVYRLYARLHMEFKIDVIDVLSYGFSADKKFVCDFLIPEAFGKKSQHFGFPSGQKVNLLVDCRFFEGFNDTPGNLRSHRGSTRVKLMDGIDNFTGVIGFQQVSGGSGLQCIEN